MTWYPGYYLMVFRDYFAHWRNKDLDTTDFDAFVAGCDSISKCGYIASTKFKYVSDVTENWQTPIETWHRRDAAGKMLGDCDDWARFFTYCLNEHELPALFLAMYSDESGHATCRLGNETVGTFRRVVHKSDDIEQIAAFWYPNWLRIRVYKQHAAEDGYRLECIKVFKRTVEEANLNKPNKSQGVVIDDFIEMLAEIDPEAYIDLINELIEEADE